MRHSAFGRGIIVAFVCLLVGSTANADPISYASFTGTVISFDSLAPGESLANQYAGLGVTFAVPNYNTLVNDGLGFFASLNSAPNVIWVNQGGGGGGGNALGMNINFASPVSGVGVFMMGTLESTFCLAVYDGDTLLEGVASGLEFTPDRIQMEGFLALENVNITRAVVYSFGPAPNYRNWNFSIDDLKFEGGHAVPEPASLLLFGTGLVGFVVARRRRR